MLANTYEIRRGAQQFASAADGMRQKANQVEQIHLHLNQWKGHAADVFHQVAERLQEDIQTASDAFERAYSALDTLANQLDQSNYLYQQAEQINSQIQSLEWGLQGADEQQRAALSGEIAGLFYRKNSLENEAQSIEYQANAAASAVFDDIAGMVNRLHFHNVTTGNTAEYSSTLDKVQHFFSGLWQSAEQEFEKVRNDLEKDKQELDQFAADHPLIGWQIGFTEGVLQACWDAVQASWGTTMMVMGADPQKEIELAKGIFHDVTHPVQTVENLLDGAKVLFSTVTQSFDDEVIHGNAYTATKWIGYATVVVAEALATDGEGGAAYAGRAAEFAKKVSRLGKVIGGKLRKGKDVERGVLKGHLEDEKPLNGVQETERSPSNKDDWIKHEVQTTVSEGTGKVIDPKVVDQILETEKGLRPSPSTYLSKEYIDNHLAVFEGGVTKIQRGAPTRPLGPPSGTFVMPKSVADNLIAKSGGDVSKLEQLLSLDPGTLGSLPVRVDIPRPTGLRMPDGNEVGANSQWIPGGYTGGGIPEATIDQVPLDKLFVTELFK